MTQAVETLASQDTPDIAPVDPVDLTKVTNVVPYGERMDPGTNKPRNHTGVDFALDKGSDILATAEKL